MELLVSVSILIVIILAVGVIFAGASRAVGMSNATNELMAGVRSTRQLLERDLAGLDRNGFLVIRSRLNDVTMGDRSWRFDQMAFMSIGAFPNRSGADTPNPFTDSSVANAAILWWGQGLMESSAPPDSSFFQAGQSFATPSFALPTGVVGMPPNALIKESECTLLRHPTLLFPGPANGNVIKPAGQNVMAYAKAERTTFAITSSEGIQADISSSRFCAVAQTPGQVMQTIMFEHASNPNSMPEADLYTFRYRALASVYDTEVVANPFVNGYFRTTPIVMQGVSSFKIEWSDGTVYPNGPLIGQLVWFGPNQPHRGPGYISVIPAATDVEHFYNSQAGNGNGDHYVAVFSFYNKPLWPKALRITMHIASDRLAGGREFSQVVSLPQ